MWAFPLSRIWMTWWMEMGFCNTALPYWNSEREVGYGGFSYIFHYFQSFSTWNILRLGFSLQPKWLDRWTYVLPFCLCFGTHGFRYLGLFVAGYHVMFHYSSIIPIYLTAQAQHRAQKQTLWDQRSNVLEYNCIPLVLLCRLRLILTYKNLTFPHVTQSISHREFILHICVWTIMTTMYGRARSLHWPSPRPQKRLEIWGGHKNLSHLVLSPKVLHIGLSYCTCVWTIIRPMYGGARSLHWFWPRLSKRLTICGGHSKTSTSAHIS